MDDQERVKAIVERLRDRYQDAMLLGRRPWGIFMHDEILQLIRRVTGIGEDEPRTVLVLGSVEVEMFGIRPRQAYPLGGVLICRTEDLPRMARFNGELADPMVLRPLEATACYLATEQVGEIPRSD